MFRNALIALLVVAALGGCRSGTPAPAAPPAAPPTTQPVSLAPTAAPPTAGPTDTPVSPTDTPVPPTNTPVPPTNTPVPTATTAPTNTPAPTATAIPRATVKTATLNVRSGPGAGYPVIASVKQGNALAVRGQTSDCAFLAVTTAEGEAGWIAGGPDFVTLNIDCAAIPKAEAPPTPTAAPATATRPAHPPAAPTQPPAAAPAEPPAPKAGEPTPLPGDKACRLFISHVGDELNMTWTAKDRQFNTSFKIPPMGQYFYCFDPGRYTWTLQHPKWTGGGEEEMVAGEHYRWPIAARD